MAKKTGMKADKKQARRADDGAGNVLAGLPSSKILIAGALLAVVLVGVVLFMGGYLQPASPAGEVPPAPDGAVPPAANTSPGVTASPSVKVPAGTNSTFSAFFFYGNGCAACEKVIPFLDDIQARYPDFPIDSLEVNENKNNFNTFLAMNREYGINNTRWAIPTVFIGPHALVGVTEIKDNLEEYVRAEQQRKAG